MRPSNRRVPSLGLLLLFTELYQNVTYHGLPPITLSIIIAQIAIYLRAFQLPWSSPTEACLSVDKILRRHDYSRLLYSQFEHADDWHLYYNMASFMAKGKSLENRMGSRKYTLLLIVFIIATALTYIGLEYALAEVLEDKSYHYRCAVGFSGVIFALKVLTTHYDSSRSSSFMGMRFNSKYAVWVELVLISVIAPSASFVGHLAGILVGFMYLYGPLKYLVDFVHDVITVIFNGYGGGWTPSSSQNDRSSHRFTSTNQSTGYRPGSGSGTAMPQPQSRNSSHSPRMTEEEQMWTAMENSLQTGRRGDLSGSDNSRIVQPSPDELRRLRLQRFQ